MFLRISLAIDISLESPTVFLFCLPTKIRNVLTVKGFFELAELFALFMPPSKLLLGLYKVDGGETTFYTLT